MGGLKEVVSLATAAEYLGLSPATLKRQAQKGRLNAALVGKTWITTRREVDRYRRENLGHLGRPGVQLRGDTMTFVFPLTDPLEEFLMEARLLRNRLQERGPRSEPTPDSVAIQDAALPLGEWIRPYALIALSSGLDHLSAWADIYLETREIPTFAHMTLLRSAVEATSRARWLIDPRVSGEERVRRVLATAVADHDERLGLPGRGPTVDVATAERRQRFLDIGSAQRIRPRRATNEALVAKYGPGDFAYSLLCAYAHGNFVIALGNGTVTSEEVQATGARRLKYGAKPENVRRITGQAVAFAQLALQEWYSYGGELEGPNSG